MYPVIFRISFVEVRSYYLLWASALFLLIFWSRYRAMRVYGMEDDDVTSVLIWVYCAGILGAFAAGVAEKLPLYWDGRLSLAQTFRGLSSGGGLLAGGLVGLWQLRKRGLSADAFADAAALPLAAMLAIGRIGCFLEGCCVGSGHYCKPGTVPWWSVHFPFDPANFFRFPSQLAESISALFILLLLAALSHAAPKMIIKRGGILFPLFMLFYGLYRLLSDPLRQSNAVTYAQSGHYIWIAALVVGLFWLSFTAFRLTHRRSYR